MPTDWEILVRLAIAGTERQMLPREMLVSFGFRSSPDEQPAVLALQLLAAEHLLHKAAPEILRISELLNPAPDAGRAPCPEAIEHDLKDILSGVFFQHCQNLQPYCVKRISHGQQPAGPKWPAC
ncbi:MAG: hypothetical protein IPL65_08225 [Lewinellaceae bacterium]|nr:hypothetical protein [Lewinellaceae bacterium]